VDRFELESHAFMIPMISQAAVPDKPRSRVLAGFVLFAHSSLSTGAKVCIWVDVAVGVQAAVPLDTFVNSVVLRTGKKVIYGIRGIEVAPFTEGDRYIGLG
jgi:hypothetical protein